MGKIENIEKYIEECDSVINLTQEKKYQFVVKIVGVYSVEIKNIKEGLAAYGYGSEDYGLDIEKIKAKLINYKDNLELEQQKRKDEIELARLQQGNINVSANANNSNNININISLDQAIENISKIPDDIMTKSEKENLEDKLSGIDAAVRSGKKEKAKEKICSVLKFLTDKGADALIVMLPYLGQMAGKIN